MASRTARGSTVTLAPTPTPIPNPRLTVAVKCFTQEDLEAAIESLVTAHPELNRQAMLDARSGIIANVGMQVTLHPRPRTTHTDGRSHRVRAIAAAR